MIQAVAKLLAIIFLLFLHLGIKSPISAQSVCSGSYSCCTNVRETCVTPTGATCYSPSSTCTCTSACTNTKYGSCEDLAADGGGCGVTNSNQADCVRDLQTNCYIPTACPSGQVFCGGCINACRANTQTCTQWINAECSGGGGGGGGSCTPSCSAPFCGQSDGCGGTCATDDGVPSLDTPTIGQWNPVANSTNPSPILVRWNNITNAYAYRYNVEQLVSGSYQFHSQAEVSIREVSLTLPSGTYRVRVRALQRWYATGRCPASAWSSWRVFNVSAPASTPTPTPTPTSTPTPTPTPLPPVCDIRANSSNGPITISSGAAATLSWTSSNAASCTASNGWTGSKSVSGSQSTGTMTVSRTYSLTCTGSGGRTCTDSVTVNVAGAPTPPPTPTPTPTSAATPTPTATPVSTPVSCVPSCSAPLCGQSNGCGGYCSTADGAASLTTPLVTSPSSGASYSISTTTNQASVPIQVQAQTHAARHTFVVERNISGTWTEVSRVTLSSTNYSFITSTAGSYRVTVRASQNVCSAQSNWSNYRLFSVTLQPPTCSLTLTPSGTLGIRGGQSRTLTANVTPAGGTVSQVAFTTSNAQAITLSTASDSTSPYQSVLTAVNGGESTITATATVTNPSGSATCTSSIVTTSGVISGRICLAPSANGGDPATAVSYSTNPSTGQPAYCYSMYDNNSTGVLDCQPVPELKDNERVSVLTGPSTTTPATVDPLTGAFRLNVDPGNNYGVRLDFDQPINMCECPQSPARCTLQPVTAPVTNLRFFYNPRPIRSPWWQVVGGNLYAGAASSPAINSPIPDDTCNYSTSVPCVAKLLLQDSAARQFSSGVAVTGGGALDTKYFSSGPQDANLDQENRNRKALGTSMTRYTENYVYFSRLYGMIEAPSHWSDWSGSTMSFPTSNPNNSKDAYLKLGDGMITEAWTLNGNRSMVVFVDGNLTISSPITVEEGSFLAIIVSGNVIISPTVCQATYTSTQGVVEGVYVADGLIRVSGHTVGTGDCKFVGEGTFVGHAGVQIQRDFFDGDSGPQAVWNAVAPASVFVYRPDFLINMPDQMKRAMYQWQEVVQ